MQINNDISLVVNTTPSYHDVAKIFLKQRRIYVSNYTAYIFSENSNDLRLGVGEELLRYSKSNFRDEYLMCLARVPSEYVITSNDDYLFVGYPKVDKINHILDILSCTQYSFVRLHRGYNYSNIKISENIFELDQNKNYYYTQGLTIWKKADLEKLFEATPPSGIGRKIHEVQFENIANYYIRELGMLGLYFYESERKRGMYHYDCSVMPHIASAIVDGKWNFAEYQIELKEILAEYNVNTELRGIYSYTVLQTIKRYLLWKY